MALFAASDNYERLSEIVHFVGQAVSSCMCVDEDSVDDGLDEMGEHDESRMVALLQAEQSTVEGSPNWAHTPSE